MEKNKFSVILHDQGNVGTLVQANEISGLTISSTSDQRLPDTISCIVEAVRPTSNGFQILFSIWNTTIRPIKVFEFVSEEYGRSYSIFYYGGQRSRLYLSPDEKSTLWSGRTDEIPSNESASFDLRYIVNTGPADGNPWIVFGIHARFHDYRGTVQTVSSDAVFLYCENKCVAIRLKDIDSVADLKSGLYSEDTVQDWADGIQVLVADGLDKHFSWKNQ